MCGIVGVLKYGEESDIANRISSLYLGESLLELTEIRGKDATGVAALFDDGNFFGQKMGIKASEFINRFGGSENDFDGLFSVLKQYQSILRIFIGHCRKKTVGGASDNMNNHPIKVGNIIGLHNGTLKNDDIIFKNLGTKRDGTVDSEAIFHLLNYYTKMCKEPFTLDIVEEVTKRLDGTFSILAFNANNPNQLVSARHDRPAEYCLIRPLKTVVIASEKKYIETVLWNYNRLAHNFTMPGFVKLTDKDVEYAELKDETIALFDLTREVNMDTKIESLYDTRPVPKPAVRIWKAAEKTNTYYNGYPTKTHGNAYNSNTEKSDKSDDTTEGALKDQTSKHTTQTSETTTAKQTTTETSTTDNGKSEKVGRVWNENLDKYVLAFGKRGDESHVILDTEKKIALAIAKAIEETEADIVDSPDTVEFEDVSDTLEIEDDPDDEFSKSPVSVEQFSIDDTVAIKTVEIEPAKEADAADSENSGASVILLDDIRDAAATGKVDSKDLTDAMKAGVDSLSTLEKFESEEEVATLCNTDAGSLKYIPLQFLANRVLRHGYMAIFLKGWEAKKAAIEKEEKMSKSQKHIRVLKGITLLLDNILSEEVNEDKSADWFKLWKESQVLGEISPNSIREIYNTGDLRENKTVRMMLSTLINNIKE